MFVHFFFFFFFSSRRRHTRSLCDWSSDVCSSDLSSIEDFRAHYQSHEGAVFLAYGVTDWLAVEIEGSQIAATFDKSPADSTGTPARIQASGTADIGGQFRFRFGHGRDHRPEFFGSVEI